MNRLPLFAFVLFLFSAVPVWAGSQLKIALHLKEVSIPRSGTCTNLAPRDLPCSSFETRGKVGQRYFVYLVAGQGDSAGIGGISCGIEYNYRRGEGVDVYSWTFCGSGQYSTPGWPASGTGNRMVWECEGPVTELGTDGVHAVAGAFYLYAYSGDLFAITPNQQLDAGPELVMSDCSFRLYDLPLSARGAIRFSDSGQEFGYNPCSGVGEVPPPPRPPDPLPPPPPPPPPPPMDKDVAFLLHLSSLTGPAVTCEVAPGKVEDIVTADEVPATEKDYTIFFLATPAYQDGMSTGLEGVRTGIGVEIPSGSRGLDVLEWVGCNDGALITMDGWPAPNSGATLTWVSCRTGEFEPVGFFRVHAGGPGALLLQGYPTDGTIRYATCAGEEGVYEPLAESRTGWVSLGGASLGTDSDGCNPLVAPCVRGPVPIHITTWGRIKSLY